MLTRDEALERAAVELSHDTDLLGTKIVGGPGVETPNFWVFYPNSVRAFASSRSADSLTSRLPPIVVDRRSGRVTRPVAAGQRVSATSLGPDEWYIADKRYAPAHDPLDGMALSEAEVARVHNLLHFRAHRGLRDTGDTLEAVIVAVTPTALELGLRDAGFVPDAFGWMLGDGHVRGSISPASATVSLRLPGNGTDQSTWTFTGHDIELAERIESKLSNAEWVRFWC